MGTKQPEAEPTRSYWIGLLGGGLVALVLIMAGLGGLAWAERLPAPPITKVEYLDEKLRFIRDNPGLDPTLMVVGSSVAWRQFDGEPFASRLGQGRVLNGASGFLKVHQTRFLTHFYMDHFPHIQTVVLMFGPPDFENCTKVPAQLFDFDDASGYAFDKEAAAPFYVRYFAPVTYLRRAMDYHERRAALTGDFWMDQYGSSPMQWTPAMMRGLRYSALHFDRACIDVLISLLTEIKVRGIRPVVVFSPIHPEYRRQYPEVHQRLKLVAEQIAPRVRPGIDFFDFSKSDFAPDDFFDAVHLQWSAVRTFSDILAKLILPGTAAADTQPREAKSIANVTTSPANSTNRLEP